MSHENNERKLIDLMNDFSDAMLVTRHDEQTLAARPMAIAEVDDEGLVWFVTDNHSGKVEDLLARDEVLITMQSGKRYVSLSGHGEVLKDEQKVKELWNESWKVWFPGGPTDPTLVLLRVTPAFGQFWDGSGLNGLSYLLKAGRAYATGTRPKTDSAEHAEVQF